MSDKKISELTDGSPAQAADELPVERGGATYRLTAADVVGTRLIYSRSLLSVATTGTSEQTLGTITIAGGSFNDSSIAGVSFQAVVLAAANTNSKSVRIRVGGIAGTVIASHIGDASSANRFSFRADLMPVASGELSGIGQSTRKAGTSFIFTVASLTGFDFTQDIAIVVTGETPTATGDLTLASLRGELLQAKF